MMQSMVTPRIKRTSGLGSRPRKYKGCKITRLQNIAGENDRGYYKSSHIITIPQEYVRGLELEKGDVFAWSVIKDSPPTLRVTKLIIPKLTESESELEEGGSA